MKWNYAPVGLSDLVVYFLRRINGLLRKGGFAAIITTNSIVDGDVRKDGLERVIAAGSQVNMAVRAIKWPGAANLIVSLLAFHRGPWNGPRMLDHQPAAMINAFFEEDEDLAGPNALAENYGYVFQGVVFRGNGFLLSHEEAERLCAADPLNAEVIMPIINGKEINNVPDQVAGRSIINFRDWSIERAQAYNEPFSIVEQKVKPYRATKNDERIRELWWIYEKHRPGLTRALGGLSRCFVAARTTKHLAFSAMPPDYIFGDVNVFTADQWELFAVVQSTLHEIWARKYSGSFGQGLRYSPSNCFGTFAFPSALWRTADASLAELGEQYHEHRKRLMQSLWIGLTKAYNLFHTHELSPEFVAKVSKTDPDTAGDGFKALLEFRRLHAAMDHAVRDAYGWQDVDLDHDFHEIETLPENDRVRFTIGPATRRELLKRLLAENHSRSKPEAEAEALTLKGIQPDEVREQPPEFELIAKHPPE